MMMRALATALLLLFAAAPVSAREMAGVRAPDLQVVAKRSVVLNGLGVRARWVWKLYLAALYLENPVHGSDAILASDQVKRLELTMLRDLTKGQVTGAFKDAAGRSDASKRADLRTQINTLFADLGALKSGEQIVITYVPGQGTSVSGRYGGGVVLPGKELADAIFSIWIGRNPVDPGLKKALVGE
jgi:hypothetical protein